MKKLITQYEKVCNDLVKLFCEKQDIEFDCWINEQVGNEASFINEYSFNLSEILFDLQTNQPKGLIFEWHNDFVDANMFSKKRKYINYKAYSNGLRFV